MEQTGIQKLQANTTIWKQDWKQLLTQCRISGNTAFADVYKADTPSVSIMVRGEKDDKKGVAVFASMIVKILKFYVASWDNEQIFDCAKVCYDEWNYLTFGELIHFSQRAKSGYFKEDGKSLIYGQFTPATLIDWLCTYTRETMVARGEHYGSLRIKNYIEPEKRIVPEKSIEPERLKALIAEFTEPIIDKMEREEAEKNAKRKDEIEKHNQLLKNVLTPEQLQLFNQEVELSKAAQREMNEIRKNIDKAAKDLNL